jgi:hypothetical protein
MAAVPVSEAGVGSAMNDTTRELGGALGVAVLGSIMNMAFLGQLNQLVVLQLLPKRSTKPLAAASKERTGLPHTSPFRRFKSFLGYVN